MMIVSVPSKHVFNEFYLRQDEILPSTTLTGQYVNVFVKVYVLYLKERLAMLNGFHEKILSSTSH